MGITSIVHLWRRPPLKPRGKHDNVHAEPVEKKHSAVEEVKRSASGLQDRRPSGIRRTVSHSEGARLHPSVSYTLHAEDQAARHSLHVSEGLALATRDAESTAGDRTGVTTSFSTMPATDVDARDTWHHAEDACSAAGSPKPTNLDAGNVVAREQTECSAAGASGHGLLDRQDSLRSQRAFSVKSLPVWAVAPPGADRAKTSLEAPPSLAALSSFRSLLPVMAHMPIDGSVGDGSSGPLPTPHSPVAKSAILLPSCRTSLSSSFLGNSQRCSSDSSDSSSAGSASSAQHPPPLCGGSRDDAPGQECAAREATLKGSPPQEAANAGTAVPATPEEADGRQSLSRPQVRSQSDQCHDPFVNLDDDKTTRASAPQSCFGWPIAKRASAGASPGELQRQCSAVSFSVPFVEAEAQGTGAPRATLDSVACICGTWTPHDWLHVVRVAELGLRVAEQQALPGIDMAAARRLVAQAVPAVRADDRGGSLEAGSPAPRHVTSATASAEPHPQKSESSPSKGPALNGRSTSATAAAPSPLHTTAGLSLGAGGESSESDKADSSSGPNLARAAAEGTGHAAQPILAGGSTGVGASTGRVRHESRNVEEADAEDSLPLSSLASQSEFLRGRRSLDSLMASADSRAHSADAARELYRPLRGPQGRAQRLSTVVEASRKVQIAEAVLEVQKVLLEDKTPTGSMVATLLLEKLLELTDAEMGCIASWHVRDDGTGYLQTHAMSNVGWTPELRQWYADNAEGGMELCEGDTLFGFPVDAPRLQVSCSPETDTTWCGVPPGHPRVASFLSVPLIAGSEVVGMCAVANSPSPCMVGGMECATALVEELRLYFSVAAHAVLDLAKTSDELQRVSDDCSDL